MLSEALASNEPELIRMALRELAGLRELGVDVDPARWLGHSERRVREAAEQLAMARRGEPTTD